MPFPLGGGSLGTRELPQKPCVSAPSSGVACFWSSRGPAALGPRGARSTRWGLLYRPLPKGKRGSPAHPVQTRAFGTAGAGRKCGAPHGKRQSPPGFPGGFLTYPYIPCPQRPLQGAPLASGRHRHKVATSDALRVLPSSSFFLLLRTATRQGGVCCPCGGLYPRFSASGRPWLSPCGRDTPPI